MEGSIDYESLSKSELVALAEDRGISGINMSMTKSEIIDVLKVAEDPQEAPPVDDDVEKFGPWIVESATFEPFVVGTQEGISCVAVITDEQGHSTEYSVSLFNGLNNYEEPVAENETDDELRTRLLATIVEEANSEARVLLMAKRFA